MVFGCREDGYGFEQDEYHTSSLQDASLVQKCHQYSDLYHIVSQTAHTEQQSPVFFTNVTQRWHTESQGLRLAIHQGRLVA